jgi:hypothetical protein
VRLIRLEFTVRQRKIGGTIAMLAPPLNPDKPKIFEQVRTVMWATRLG